MLYIKKASYFQRLLIHFITIVLILLLVMTISLYISFKSYALDYIYKSSLNMLHQIDSNITQINEYAIAYSTSLYSNVSCQKLMYSIKPYIIDTLRSIWVLDGLSRSTPFVQSMEIYNSHTDNIYYISPVISLIRTKENPYDTAFMGLLKNYRNSVLDPVPRKIRISPYSDSQANVLTYIITDRSIDKGDIRSALVVNVNIDWIFSSIQSSAAQQGVDNLYLLDSEGIVKASTSEKLFMSDISKEPFVAHILSQKDNSGSFIENTADGKMLICYIKSETSDWIVVNSIPYSYIAESVLNIKSFTVIIGILTIMLGVLLSIVYTRNLYNPIHSLLKKTSSIFQPVRQDNSSSDEFDLISNTIVSASERINGLQSFKSKSIHIMRQEFLNSLLLARFPSREQVIEESSNLNLQITLDSVILPVLLKIDHYAAFCDANNEFEQDLLKYGFLNILKEILMNKFKCETVDMGSDHVVAIIELGESGALTVRDIELLLKDSVKVFSENFKISFSIFIGNPCEIEDVSSSYRQLLKTSDYRIVYGHGCVVKQQDIDKRQFSSFNVNTLCLKTLVDALTLCNLEKLKSSYETIEEILYNCRYSDIDMVLSYTISIIFDTISIIERNSDITFEENYASFKAAFETLETLKEAKEAIFSLFERLTEKISLFRNDKNKLIVKKATDYIDSNYYLPDISLNTISAMFNLTPSYFNKIFREITSMSVSDYITGLKIKNAANLLAGSNLTIEEITRHIGWDNKNYFFTVFKKITGVTPSEYRIKFKSLISSISTE